MLDSATFTRAAGPPGATAEAGEARLFDAKDST